MPTALIIAIALILALVLLYRGQAYWAWVVPSALGFTAWVAGGVQSPTVFVSLLAIFAALATAFGNTEFRTRFISSRLMRRIAKILPTMGDTERIALEAGTVWWDGELFSGNPDWKKLLAFQPKPLTEKEKAFLDGPVEQLCAMIDDWQVAQERDLPREVWDFMKREKFFGMIIPEKFGGLGFSAIAHSAVVTKLSSRSVPAAVTVMVPNSLGPAELLLHYGTDAQKSHYLPRLATGEELPCFALTGPEAGSDAASTESTGIVCRGMYKGKEVLGLRLNWRKRYITLAPIATVVGLAFRAHDPDGLLGGESDLGITCALIPRNLKGIDIGTRHDPMGVPFQNGPIFGRDVFVPLDTVIGGRDGLGKGWRMLMECLAAGRSISLPSLSVGAAQLATRVTGAYGTVREQFNTPIGKFEGIEEPLARIGGYTYLMNATRTLTCGAVDAGEKPAVLSGIAKAYLTEGMRQVLNDAFDIRAGAAICRGPKNILGRGYIGVPIAITVEGANILTRSLIVYGQGAIRSHPYIQEEMAAIAAKDVAQFDKAFFGHAGFAVTNMARALVMGLTGGANAPTPRNGEEATHYRRLTRFSAAFAFISDMSLASLGGSLKRREKISGRLADALAWMYLASASLKRFDDEGRRITDQPLLDWSCETALNNVENALIGVIDNFPNRAAAMMMRGIVFPRGTSTKPPSDRLGAQVAEGLLDDGVLRKRLTSEIYVPALQEPGLGRLEAALDQIVAAAPAKAKVKKAVRAGQIDAGPADAVYQRSADAGVIDASELFALKQADMIRDEVIQVDDFDTRSYARLKG